MTAILKDLPLELRAEHGLVGGKIGFLLGHAEPREQNRGERAQLGHAGASP